MGVAWATLHQRWFWRSYSYDCQLGLVDNYGVMSANASEAAEKTPTGEKDITNAPCVL